MKTLPDEILLHIISYLEPKELVSLQIVSHQYLSLARDNELWKRLCFERSEGEKRRRRQQLAADLDPRLAELLRAADSFRNGIHEDNGSSNTNEETQSNEARRKTALLANWDPTYPDEKVNWYRDYIQRHAPHSMSWFQHARHGHQDDNLHHEATGAGVLFDSHGMADKLVAPLEDGSVCIWSASESQGRMGKIIARSSIGLLANRGSDLDYDTRLKQSRAIMTETGAVECVSIDSRKKKAFFAVQNTLNEVDLNTLRVVSRTPYPFPITALSEARHPTPLTVGTNWTIHLHDTRKPPSLPLETRTELIGGNPSTSYSRIGTGDFGGHVSLSQPGALSILHLPTTRDWDGNGDIWVGGRFTSFLNFDRRYFPRLRGTVHSGARLSCLTAIPHPFIPNDLRINSPYSPPGLLREAKSTPGYTLIASGEYKGKGSLELYSLSSDPARSINPSDTRTTKTQHACYQNRQTASSSKLLSVAPHGTRLVFSDGEGNMKWVERDGSTFVRKFNINDTAAPGGITNPAGLEEGWGEIVQKILPTVSSSTSTTPDLALQQDNLVIWTGDGRLGLVGFGGEAFKEARQDELEEAAMEHEARQLRVKEREYGAEMRRALEHQARELRWLRGYGL